MRTHHWKTFAPALLVAALAACGQDATPPDHAPATDDTAASTGEGANPAPTQGEPAEGTALEAQGTGNAPATSIAPASTAPVLAVSTGDAPHLVDASGAAVYYMDGNMDGSRCDADCERAWPPVVATAGQAQAAQGVDGAAISNLQRANGGMQVSYDGKPLYRYAGDQGPGRTSGDGVKDKWGTWHLAKAK